MFNTLLIRIEACLNSLPITPITSDPNDLTFPTPGHFLIGDSLTALVEPNLQEVNMNRLDMWQHIERIRQHFWKSWSREYITQFQARMKWKTQGPSLLKVGFLVMIVDDNLPPLQWSLGRVLQLHPGSDGVLRVITLKTINGEIKRAVHRVCILPMNT